MGKCSLLKITADFHKEDKSMTIFDLLLLMKQLLTCQICSVSFYKGDDIQGVRTRWDQDLLPASEVPKECVLESLYKIKIREFL